MSTSSLLIASISSANICGITWHRVGPSLPLLLFAPAMPAAETPDLSVPLPLGETLLADIGTYRVFWQSYGQEPFAMPVSWSGHFEPRAGISYQDWGHHRGTYQGDADNLLALKDHGVDHLAIISHVWQRYGYDVKLPDHLPANPAFGGDEGMIAFGKAANQCGYIWSLHENYIDLYPDAPSYDPSARVLRSDGTPSPAWYNAGTKVQSFGLKCNRAPGYAKQNAPEIHRRFNTTAAYLDVHTCVPPWHQLDHEADQPMAAMALAKVKHDIKLFQFMREVHGGPLFGEGANHLYWAGRCDGVEAQIRGGDRILVARLKLEKQDGKISNITAEKITTDNQPKSDNEVDFAARLNPPGTWIDFGKVATDGSAKIQREPKRLIIFPYPREKPFRVSLNLQALAPSADPKHVQVLALAAGTQQSLGAADFTWEGGSLVLTVGTPGAGRYAVTWKPNATAD